MSDLIGTAGFRGSDFPGRLLPDVPRAEPKPLAQFDVASEATPSLGASADPGGWVVLPYGASILERAPGHFALDFVARAKLRSRVRAWLDELLKDLGKEGTSAEVALKIRGLRQAIEEIEQLMVLAASLGGVLDVDGKGQPPPWSELADFKAGVLVCRDWISDDGWGIGGGAPRSLIDWIADAGNAGIDQAAAAAQRGATEERKKQVAEAQKAAKDRVNAARAAAHAKAKGR